MRQIELLAPAGDRLSFIGAINAGANAVYLSGKRFGAREYADNFTQEDLAELIEYAHIRGVRVYVTINTLIYEDEWKELLQYSDFLVSHHVDALIVQDLGILSHFTKRYPDTEIHVSTQMNTYNLDQLKFVESLGVKRVILARETSIDTIKRMKSKVDLDLEVFVHGALCISYSGNCLFSSMHGGRSGNRGQCAQSCRMLYTLYRDEELIELEAYLLSAKDLMTIEKLDQIIASGVSSLKIEGRMRRPEYVIATVRAYREALDHLYDSNHVTDLNHSIRDLSISFNREYTNGHILNAKPYEIVNPKRPNHMGIQVGEVIRCHQKKADILLTDTLRRYDGIRILGNIDVGGEVSRIMKDGVSVDVAYPKDMVTIDLTHSVIPGSPVMKTRDVELEAGLKDYQNENKSIIGLTGELNVSIGKPLLLRWKTDYSNSIEVSSEFIVVPAMTKSQSKEQIFNQISKLGDTPFYLNDFKIHIDESVFVPNGVLNQLRREGITSLISSLLVRKQERILPNMGQKQVSKYEKDIKLIAKVETEEQYQAALEQQVDMIYLAENLKIKHLNDNEYLYMNRIWNDLNEYQDVPRIVIRDIGGVAMASNHTVVSDSTMNVTNSLSAAFLLNQNMERVTLSLENTVANTKDILYQMKSDHIDPSRLEHIVYGRADLMLTKYCPITKSEGIYRTDCSLCQRNQYSLHDQKNGIFPLKRDGYCNIRVLHSKVLNLIRELPELIDMGISAFRLDFTDEDYHKTVEVIKAFKNRFQGRPYVMLQIDETSGRFYR